MIINVNFSLFCDQFSAMGRYGQFSYEAKKALYDYLEEIDSSYELDVIALCCDFVEYDNLVDYNYQNDTKYESWNQIDSLIALVNCDGALCLGV